MEPSREPYVCAGMLWPLIAGLRYLGLPADELMRQAGLPEARTLEADRRLPLEAPLRFIELAIAHHGEGIGLELARLYELGGFGLLDLIAQASRTLGEAITCMCQYEQANQNALESWLEVRDGQAILSQRHFHALPVPRQLTENSLANFIPPLPDRASSNVSGSCFTDERSRGASPVPSAPDQGPGTPAVRTVRALTARGAGRA